MKSNVSGDFRASSLILREEKPQNVCKPPCSPGQRWMGMTAVGKYLLSVILLSVATRIVLYCLSVSFGGAVMCRSKYY